MLCRRVSLAFLGVLSASSLTALGQTPKWALDGAAFSETPAAIQLAAAAVKAEPLMSTTVLFEQERYVLAADGRTVQTHQMVYRIEDKTGVEEWNQTSVEWDPWYQERPSIKARVIGADGKVSELDVKTLTDVPAKNESEDTFSDSRIYKGPLPGVAVGSIVEEETVVTDKSPFFAGGGIYRTYFSRSVPVVRSRLVVEVPEDVALKTKTHSLPETAVVKVEASGKNKVYSYDLSPVPMAQNSDIALATDKPRSVFVEFATGASWASVAEAYRKLSDGQIQPEQVKSLVAGMPQGDSMATIAALVAKLHKEIRYTGVEFGESALKPQTPAEVLKRHYGDCKDKAALLVGMLRASGIPAELALLSTGPGYDVGAELAGMNQFNHAIVHVPAGKNGRQELWIDATAEFTKVGDLPYPDQGRMALLIAEGTTGLTQIPEAKSTDSVDVETREFELKQFGPARVVETSMTTGHIDADYRYRYGGAETKSTKEDLEGYAKRFYNAKALTHMEHTDGSDLTKPFVLKLEMDKAGRGTSDLGGAAVGIPPTGTMSTLPRWFFNDTEADETKLTDEQKAELAKAKLQRAEEYEVQPFIEEVHYRVIVPEGFVPRALPEEQTLHMGPAVMTRHYAQEKDASGKMVVTAVMRFDTVKPRYTTDEVLALRKAAVEQNKLQYILLQFDQVGAKAIAEGKVREGLAADRALIAAHPDGSGANGDSEDAAMHHVHLSAALLGVGLGEAAKKEARRATELDPKLQIAWLQLGVSLEHNDIGVRFGKGFDRMGALEAYRRAKPLDTENIYPTVDIAVLSEYNDEGERYAAGANLADAVKEYRTLKTIDPNTADSYEDSLLFDLLYDRKYAELTAELKTLPMNATRDAMAVAAVAASGNDGKGDAAAALKRADLVAGGDEQKSAALRLAGLELIRLQRYPLAAELLKAATAGQADSPQMAQQIAVFGNLKSADLTPLPATDPKAPVRLMLTSMMTGKMVQEVPNFLDRNAYATEKEWQENLKHNDDASGAMRTMAANAQLPMAVMRDIVLGNAKLTATGDDAKGYRVTLTSLGAAPQSLFVTKDDGKYRIVADGTDSAEVGNYALYLLAHGREPEARNLLDWKRELVHKGGGDDPLEGMLFPQLWTVSSSSKANTSSDAIRVAALSLTIAKPANQASIEPALAAWKAASEASAATPGSGYAVADLERLLAYAYINKHDFKAAAVYADKLLAEYPDSLTAIRVEGQVYQGTGNFKAWNAMLKPRLEAKPGDHDLLEQASGEAEAEGDFARARADLQQIMDAGKATSNDYNSYGWMGLFDDHLDAKTIEAAQQANQLTKNASFAELHTLACVYAAVGKTTEARQLLLAAMAARNESEPSEEVWFGLGLTYEQFGEKEAAIAAYKRVKKPETTLDSPVATYVLAEKRLKGLGA
jgi:tetratricopeptide (TPR) repeat protein